MISDMNVDLYVHIIIMYVCRMVPGTSTTYEYYYSYELVIIILLVVYICVTDSKSKIIYRIESGENGA